MHNVILRHIRLTIFAVESDKYAYSECVSVVFVIQHAMLIRRTVICGLPGATIFFNIVS